MNAAFPSTVEGTVAQGRVAAREAGRLARRVRLRTGKKRVINLTSVHL